MWKEYSWNYIRKNRASGLSVMVAAFISALLLSLLMGLFYNFWRYEIESIKREEGDWQGRIVGQLDGQTLEKIRCFANVEKAVINETYTGEGRTAVDIILRNKRTILSDMPQIAKLAGLPPEAVSYHHSLLNMYLIRDPQDPAPRLIFPALLGITCLACFSLVMIIHNSFAVSMNARLHQFGIFSSIGATPAQIRACLLQESAALCCLPVLFGNLLGIAASAGVINLVNQMAAQAAGRHDAAWTYHPLVFLSAFAITAATIGVSAWLPARRLSGMTPLEAIRTAGELQLPRKKTSPICSRLFGIEGELAGNALKAQKKALRTANLSLICSFLAFTLMQCFFTLSDISTRMTYFEAYQDTWDIMVTVKDAKIGAFDQTDEIRQLTGVRDCVAYQRCAAARFLSLEEISGEMEAFGGFSHAPENFVTKTPEGFWVSAPIVILDDESFLAYCGQIGAEARLDGAVILNQIRDVTNPDFRNPVFVPYLKEDLSTSLLYQAGHQGQAVEIAVTAYTRDVPLLREEYATLDHYELVHFLPVSLWREIGGLLEDRTDDFSIRILAMETDLNALTSLEKELQAVLGDSEEIMVENRVQEKIANDRMIDGMMAIFGGFCVLLALIGIGNVFSNTLGFVRQRRREFARYLSVGLTPGGMKKMFCIEALVLAGRPVLITLPVTVAALGFMLKASYLEPIIFIREAPFGPVLGFILAIFGFVGTAYFLGWNTLKRISLTDALRDDTLM